MKSPADVYTYFRSTYLGFPQPHYPFHDNYCRRHQLRPSLSLPQENQPQHLARQAVGIQEVDQCIWLVRFMDYDLRYFDVEENALQPLENPFGPNTLPTS